MSDGMSDCYKREQKNRVLKEQIRRDVLFGIQSQIGQKHLELDELKKEYDLVKQRPWEQF